MGAPVAQRLLAAAASTAGFTAAAHAIWLVAITRALESLRDPACVRWIGPVVQGATMAGGARVPGTSYDLDPAQAAFSLSLMLEWPVPAPQASDANVPCTFGALLAVADYRSRRALALGGSPWTVAQLTSLLASVEALSNASAAPDLPSEVPTPGALTLQQSSAQAPLQRLRTASALGTALLCEADEQQCLAVLRLANLAPLGSPAEPAHDAMRAWLHAHTAGDGVRRGLLALRVADVLAAAPDASSATLAGLDLTGPNETWTGTGPAALQDAMQRFESAVTLHFPLAQAERIKSTLCDRERCAGLGVHELLALLMRN